MHRELRNVGILGTGSSLPEREMTNDDMAKIVDTSHDWIVSRTGIESRRFADENTATSDLASEAAIKAMEAAGVTADQIDLIIVGTLTPDHIIPSTACIVQEKIGATKAAAFDLEAACSGFVYSVAIAQQFITTGMYNHVLVIGAETMSKILDFEDRKTCVLFGDGAGAVVLGPVGENKGILSMDLGADGSGGPALMVPAGGTRMPATPQTVKDRLHYLTMDGSEVFKFAVRTMPRTSKNAIDKAGLTVEDIDFMIPHQANTRIISSAAKRLKLPMEKVHVNLDKLGNMSAASIPVALDEAVREGKLKDNDKVVLVGFGAGLTWGGACVINW